MAFEGPELPPGLEVKPLAWLARPPAPLAGVDLAAELPDPAEAPAPGPSWAQLEQPADPAQLEAPAPELPPDVDPADPAASPSGPLEAPAPGAALESPAGHRDFKPDPARLEAPELPAHLADTPEAWAAFLDEAPWIDPAERRRILADAFGSSPTPRPRSHP